MNYEEQLNQRRRDELAEIRAGTLHIVKIATRISWICITIVVGLMYGCPQYNVYSSRKDGEAQLAHAKASKEVAVAEAKAKMESATYEAQADTIRAHGVATSNKIIGQSLNQNEAYLKWLWIDNIEKNPNAVIYIPTEANMPIMEASRFK